MTWRRNLEFWFILTLTLNDDDCGGEGGDGIDNSKALVVRRWGSGSGNEVIELAVAVARRWW